MDAQRRMIQQFAEHGSVEGKAGRRALREALIEVIADHDAHLYDGHGGRLVQANAIDLVNEIERALREHRDGLRDRLDQLRYIAPAGRVRPGTKELRIVLKDVSEADEPPAYHFIELEDQDGAGVGGFPFQPTGEDDLLELVIPYGRDDEWVQSVVMTAVQAGHDCDVPFPGDTVDQVLQQFGVRPSRPRTWPKAPPLEQGEEPGAVKEYDPSTEAPPEREEEGEGRPPLTADDSPGGYDPAVTIKFLEDETERLLGEREQARAGEDTFKAERDAALFLIRHLIGNIIPPELVEVAGSEGP